MHLNSFAVEVIVILLGANVAFRLRLIHMTVCLAQIMLNYYGLSKQIINDMYQPQTFDWECMFVCIFWWQ